MLKRREFVLSCGAVLATSAIPLVRAQEPSSLAFLVIGDWGKPDRHEDASRVATQMGVTAEADEVRFVISTGDNFYEGGVATIEDTLWRTVFEDVYVAPALNCPWYAVLGNHDYRGNSQAEIDYATKSQRWTMPSRYYKVSKTLDDGTKADFFFIDTEPFVDANWWNQGIGAGKDANDQLAWLDAGLAGSDAPWKFVIGHHPVYAGGTHGSTSVLIERLEPLLKRYGVQAYFNGHNHDLQHLEVGGVHYFNSGAGAESKPTNAIAGTLFAQQSLGFLLAKLHAQDLQIDFISDQGVVLHSASIPV